MFFSIFCWTLLFDRTLAYCRDCCGLIANLRQVSRPRWQSATLSQYVQSTKAMSGRYGTIAWGRYQAATPAPGVGMGRVAGRSRSHHPRGIASEWTTSRRVTTWSFSAAAAALGRRRHRPAATGRGAPAVGRRRAPVGPEAGRRPAPAADRPGSRSDRAPPPLSPALSPRSRRFRRSPWKSRPLPACCRRGSTAAVGRPRPPPPARRPPPACPPGCSRARACRCSRARACRRARPRACRRARSAARLRPSGCRTARQTGRCRSGWWSSTGRPTPAAISLQDKMSATLVHDLYTLTTRQVMIT